MTNQSNRKNSLTGTAFMTLLLVGLIMGSNHVSARIAFNHGLSVGTAVVVRSVAIVMVMALLVYLQKVPVALTKQQVRMMPLIGVLMTVQGYCLYSAVARLPVSLALLAFNTYPLWITFWAKVIYGEKTPVTMLRAMPVLLVGLALALDVFGTSSGLGIKGQWMEIGAGVAFALTSATTFGIAMVLTQNETKEIDGRVRTGLVMTMVGTFTLIGVEATGGLQWPHELAGWGGLAGLTLFYGTGFTIMFTILPKIGAVGNSAIMNVEPICALGLGWLILNQSVSLSQLIGAVIVVGTVIFLGLRR